MKRTRLRSRVFIIATGYALMLIGIAFILTWRARLSQREFNHILDVDSRVIRQLEDLERAHNAYASYWVSEGKGDPTRYSTVKQMLQTPPLSWEHIPAIRRAIQQFENALRSGSTNLPDVPSAIETEISTRKQGVDRRIRTLAGAARNTMWVALGIAYIIAILSFAVARLTLSKLVRPLEDLSRAAERLAAEDFSVRARVEGDLEVARLAASFNRMAEKISLSHDTLRERARTDELTGLPNFRAFRESLAGEIERARRYRHRFGILVFDIDHFKRYNDEFGHLGGNEALKAVAETIRRTLRTVDLAARYGGEEFVAVLPEVEPQGLEVLAERIRLRIAAMPPLQGDRRITISIGGAIYPQDGTSDEELFETADNRLYEAKGAGRNRAIVLSKPETKKPGVAAGLVDH